MELLQQKYVYVKTISEGSYSSVYLVKDKNSKKKFAVKHLKKGQLNPWDYVNEARVFDILKRNPSPYIVQMFEQLEDDEHLLFVEEYCSNGTLLSFLNSEKRKSETVAKKLFFQLSVAVQHLHSLGIVHRDLKLENVCLGKTGDVKLIDFNFSCFWSQDSKLTKFCGSPYYSSPEIYREEAYFGPEVDSWSLGVCLYSLLFYTFPFNVTNASGVAKSTNQSGVSKDNRRQELGKKVIEGKYDLPAGSGVTLEAQNLIKQILVVNSEQRLSVTQILADPWLSGTKQANMGIPRSLSESTQGRVKEPFLAKSETVTRIRSDSETYTRMKYMVKKLVHFSSLVL
eukprot:TRINITY_DN3546_c0_g1_i1.p1 TRINITY_DN3546_c0_g1~~TRINITY_DN3546_c0_g1_i1.p1  ORF type:complete len:341 (-),score=54.77 TRINITY_DN3546_c0_g1_i1:175-1197(-)